MAKRLLLHRYDGIGKVESKAFDSRAELCRSLRANGLRFSNSAISEIGEGLVVLHSPDGKVRYEIEELFGDDPDDIVMINGKAYISVGKYCRDTGRSERDVYRAYHLDRRK